MAKRFTDTGKWDKAWFRKLSPEMKCAWIFLCDRCDHAGVWEMDIDALQFFTGADISADDLTNCFGDKVEVSGTKLVLTSFAEFQYGHLNPENRVHKSVLLRLEKLAPNKPLKRPLKGTKDTDTDKDADTNKEKGESEGILKSKALEIYHRYPRKKGKTEGLKRLLADFKKGYTFAQATDALDRTIAEFKTSGTGKEFIPYFSTWVSTWHDALDDDHGESQDFSQAKGDKLDPSRFVKPGGAA